MTRGAIQRRVSHKKLLVVGLLLLLLLIASVFLF